jgi:hypothetical protein
MHRLRGVGRGLALVVTLVSSLATAQSIKADHTTVDETVLSSSAIEAAKALKMNFSHASVGGNIWNGLDTLAQENNAFSHPNWTENNRGNPGWEAKITDFESWVEAHQSEFKVFQNKFCYIDQDADFETYRDSMVNLVKTYQDKLFVFWTMPLQTSGADNTLRATFNQKVRDFCEENDYPLFDIAAIESHTASGTAVTESGDEAMDPAQSSDGGHLNELGAARAAAAQWVLMAKLAGQTVGNTTGGTPSTDTTAGGTPSNNSVPTSSNTDESEGTSSGCTIALSLSNVEDQAVIGFTLLALFLRKKRKLPLGIETPTNNR